MSQHSSNFFFWHRFGTQAGSAFYVPQRAYSTMSDKDNSVKSGSYVFRETKESASRVNGSPSDIEENGDFEKRY